MAFAYTPSTSLILYVDGVDTPVEWSGGSPPSHGSTYLIIGFSMIDKIPANPAGNEEYVVFGSASSFG